MCFFIHNLQTFGRKLEHCSNSLFINPKSNAVFCIVSKYGRIESPLLEMVGTKSKLFWQIDYSTPISKRRRIVIMWSYIHFFSNINNSLMFPICDWRHSFIVFPYLSVNLFLAKNRPNTGKIPLTYQIFLLYQ